MRGPFLKGRGERRGIRERCCLAIGVSCLALALLLVMAAPVHGEERASISGRVVNGTSDGVDPPNLQVTLHVISEGQEVDITTARTDSDGQFQFQEVEVDEGATYALTSSYQDVLYSKRLDPLAMAEPVVLLVYETTTSLEAIHVDTDALLLGGADPSERTLSAFEVVSLVNSGDHTFVPNLAQPGSMNFLRFSLPSGATDLDVASDLPGAQIVNVGTGFALMAPVTPGSHQVTYAYRTPYKGNRLELARSFPMGAESFRLLMEDGLGVLRNSSFLTQMPPASRDGKSYRVWGASQLNPGVGLTVEVGDLPQPALLRRVGDALTDGPYLRIGIPTAVGLALVVLLLYALVFRRPEKVPVGNPGPGHSGALLTADELDKPVGSSNPKRRLMVEEIARLDDLFQEGEVAQEEYLRRRQQLKDRLLRLANTSEGK